jgi:glutathione S-transferase
MAIPAGYILGAAIIKFATEALFENFRIGDDLLAGREYFFDHFTAPDAHFFSCCRRATPVGGGPFGLPQRHGAFQAHAGAPARQEAARLRVRSE